MVLVLEYKGQTCRKTQTVHHIHSQCHFGCNLDSVAAQSQPPGRLNQFGRVLTAEFYGFMDYSAA